MNVLLIHLAFSSLNEPGGTRHYELARHFVSKGHNFTAVASNLTYKTGKRIIRRRGLFSEQNLEGVRILRAYTYPSLHRSYMWRVVSFLSFMVTSVLVALSTESIDLVMGTSPPIFQAISAWFVAKFRRRPFLLEIRDLWPEFAIDIGVLKNPMLIILSQWVERFLYTRATHLLVNSPAYLDYLMTKGVPMAKISLIPNGVDSDMFDPDAKGERIRQELKLDKKFVATYTGAMGLANDIQTILKAANRLHDQANIHFLLVGDGKERGNLELLTLQLKLSNVTFTGARPKSEIPEILATSDVCIATLKDIPMFRLTYPNKVFDYMAAARPTILAIDGVIRKVVEAARGGVYIPPGDDEALANAISNLYLNQSLRKDMGLAARSYVCLHFNRHHQAEVFIKLLQRLTKN